MLFRSYLNRAVAYLELGWPGKAMEDCRKALKLDPADAAAHYNLACSYSLLGRTREAVQSLERAIVLEPNLRDDAISDEDLDSIRDEEGFARLMMGL